MKLRKTVAALAASTVAVSAMALSASAVYTDGGVGSIDGSGMFTLDLVAEGIDYENITQVTFTIEATTDADFGGGVMFNGTACGWSQDESNFYSGPEGDKDLKCVATGDLTYTLTVDVPAGIYGTYTDEDFYAQICVQEWWGDDVKITAYDVVCGDAAPAEEEVTAPAEEEVTAPAEEETTAGDVDAATDSSKGSPDTGVADVAVVAGLAIVAAVAVLVSKKRK